jgi:hypothetical protein
MAEVFAAEPRALLSAFVLPLAPCKVLADRCVNRPLDSRARPGPRVWRRTHDERTVLWDRDGLAARLDGSVWILFTWAHGSSHLLLASLLPQCIAAMPC